MRTINVSTQTSRVPHCDLTAQYWYYYSRSICTTNCRNIIKNCYNNSFIANCLGMESTITMALIDSDTIIINSSSSPPSITLLTVLYNLDNNHSSPLFKEVVNLNRPTESYTNQLIRRIKQNSFLGRQNKHLVKSQPQHCLSACLPARHPPPRTSHKQQPAEWKWNWDLSSSSLDIINTKPFKILE